MDLHVFKACPALKRDFLRSFPFISNDPDFVIILILQDSKTDLLQRSDNKAKDQCIERFFEVVRMLEEELNGKWCDFIDPSSGLLVKTDSCSVFSDVEICSRLLKIEHTSYGGCMMIKHPKFGFSLYPGSFFTNASVEDAQLAVDKVLQKCDKIGWGTNV